ncbi:MAG TPA: type II secretion system protein [Tepidisphaeraceae bacterium]|jgi:type II secretory pathway component PulJ|nr:type II secretion system protein [Tepidisphaeraceae bacterium]
MSRRPAFTLLELLISMAFVAVIALSLAASMKIAFDARRNTERKVDAARSSGLVMDFLREDFQCAMPPTNAGGLVGTFEGSHGQDPNADDLVFYTTAPSPLHPEGSNGEIKQVELTMYQPDNSTDHILVRRSNNNLAHPLVQAIPDEEILCRHVQSFNLFYFDGTSWQDTWDSTASQPLNSLPLAVQVVLAIQTPQTNPDGTPVVITYTHVFAFPCTSAGGPPQ